MIKFSCPKCGQSLRGRDDMAGMPHQCPTCSGQITIPGPPVPRREDQGSTSSGEAPGTTWQLKFPLLRLSPISVGVTCTIVLLLLMRLSWTLPSESSRSVLTFAYNLGGAISGAIFGGLLFGLRAANRMGQAPDSSPWIWVVGALGMYILAASIIGAPFLVFAIVLAFMRRLRWRALFRRCAILAAGFFAGLLPAMVVVYVGLHTAAFVSAAAIGACIAGIAIGILIALTYDPDSPRAAEVGTRIRL